MISRVHYIGQYSENIDFRNLRVFPSAITKINYLVSCLLRSGYEVIVFSPAETKNTFFCHYRSITSQIENNFFVKYIDTFGGPNLLLKSLSRIWTYIQMVYYLLYSVKKNEIVLVYHTWIYRWPIRIVKLFKKINLYYEVEEIFHAAWKKSPRSIKNEISFLKGANGYIVVNDLMKDKLFTNKPIVVCYGSYKSTYIEKDIANSECIQIVYAGSIEGVQSDVFLAINIISYLPNNYCLNILGYGTQEHISKMEEEIVTKNNSLGRTAIRYYGCMSGLEYYSFLAKSNIGLCTRLLENIYSDYTFPSKILVYLGNNLIPVCTPISSLMKSSINNYLVFSDDNNPESLAKAILSIDSTIKVDFGKVINMLDNNFCLELATLLENRIS